jgi:hypothetical protein
MLGMSSIEFIGIGIGGDIGRLLVDLLVMVISLRLVL